MPSPTPNAVVLTPGAGAERPHLLARFVVTAEAADPVLEVVFGARDAANHYFCRALPGQVVIGKRLAGQESVLVVAPSRWWRGPGEYTLEVEVVVSDCDERGPAWFVNADRVPPMLRLRARVRAEGVTSSRGWPVTVVDDPILPGQRGEPYWDPDPFATSSARRPLGSRLGYRSSPGVTCAGIELLPERQPRPEGVSVKPSLRIATGDRGGCWLALGDLDGDGRLDYLVARNDNQAVTALTAYSNDGAELWRWGSGGRPDISYDVPATICDLDGDGRAEALCSVHGFLVVLDGATGAEKARLPLPKGLDVADCLVVANLRGSPQPEDLLLKSRYDHLWAVTNTLAPLWEFHGNVGHHPCVRDVDGDGRDEVLCGYALLDHDGSVLWQQNLPDHADTTRLAEMEPGGPIRALLGCGGGYDMALVSLAGKVLWHEAPGIKEFHFQSAQVGDLRPDLPGCEIIVDDGWARPARAQLALFDAAGHWIGAYYPAYPRFARLVDWNGDGSRQIVLPADHAVYDGQGRCVARLADAPAFGGPGAESPMVRTADVNGDGRDELILYNAEEIVVYANPHRASRRLPPQPVVQEQLVNFTYY